MDSFDDDLKIFERDGAPALPVATAQGYVENKGARIFYRTFGSGSPVLFLHGGLGHGGNWGHQVPAFLNSKRQVILIDSRGHGRSTRDSQPYTYELMATDALAVLDTLHIRKVAVVGWSDGACVGMVLAMKAPERVSGVFFFGCNMDPSGTKEFVPTPVIDRCFSRHTKDYAQLSATPDQFHNFVDAVNVMMKTEPNYNAQQLADGVGVPVWIVQSEHDEFIKREHAEYLAHSIRGARFVLLPNVSHFAPLQRPALFNQKVLEFLGEIGA